MTQQEFLKRYNFDVEEDYLGGGGFGKVYKASDEILDRTVAIKVAEVQKGRENLSLLKEVELAQRLPIHRNIVHYQECHRFKMSNGVFDYGILQYYPLGNLSQLIKNNQLTYQEKEEIAKGIIKGIDHLHQHNVVHRDIKSSNVLISKSKSGRYIPKIADFGLSKEFTDTVKSYFSNSFAGGSLLFVAPEQLKGGQIRKNVDLWSMGVMFFELFTGQVPFYAAQDDGTETARQEIIVKIQNATLPNTLNEIPQPWQELIQKCLVVDSKDRLKDTNAALAIIEGKPSTALNKPKAEATIIEEKKDSRITDKTVVEQPPKSEPIQSAKPPKASNPNTTTIPWLPILIGVVVIVLGIWFFNSGGGEEYAEQEVAEDAEQEVAEDYEGQAESNGYGIDMVKIPSGTFQMGSNDGEGDEQPVHAVSVSSFSMSKYEVTQKLWEDVMGTNPSYFKNCDNCPVEKVSWNDVQEFIKKLNAETGKNYRLPTEAEWEYAARGGQNYKYAGSNNIGSVAWYDGNSYDLGAEDENYGTNPVGQKSPNGYGLYDMSGNVYEWCQDVWHDDYSGAPTDGSAWTSGGNSDLRVLRGGSWLNSSEYCRPATRRYITQTYRLDLYGFRLVLP